MTNLVASDTAYLPISPGERRCTAVWISPLVIVKCLLERARCLASLAIRSNISFTNESMTFTASWERLRPVCTCLSTLGK